MTDSLRIGMIAGEASGDQLGAPLIGALRRHFPKARFAGIGGERMMAEGFDSLYPLERLSVMGLVEPLKRLPELLRIRRGLYRHFSDNRYDLVLGIDAPDFNLGLELKLRRRGLATAHYVSPSVWAWRQGRVRKIAKAVDLMLTLFPFETDFYRDHGVPVRFVGHPLADQLPMAPDRAAARQRLDLPAGSTLLAMLPGSRGGEVALMAPLFLQVAQTLRARHPGLEFAIPAASGDRYRQLAELLRGCPDLPVRLIKGCAHDVMEAADAVLLASGTTALEAMLLKRPMVVSYKLEPFTYSIVSRLVKTPYVALPNLIAGAQVVPELIQAQATVEALAIQTETVLFDEAARHRQGETFAALHRELRMGAAASAADALAELIDKKRGKHDSRIAL